MFRQISYRNALIVKFIIVAVFPIILFGVALLNYLPDKLQKNAMDKNLLLARSLASDIDELFAHPENELYLIADSIENNRFLDNTSISNFLKATVKHHSIFSSIKILNKNGQLKYSSVSDDYSKGYALGAMPFAKGPVKHGRTFWSSPFLSEQTRQTTITISIPFSNGVVVGYVELVVLRSIIEKMALVNAGGEYIFITDKNGTVIAHPDISMVMQRVNLKNLGIVKDGLAGKHFTSVFFLKNRKYIGSAVKTERAGWLLVVAQPIEQAFAVASNVKAMLWIGIAITIILSIGLSIRSSTKFFSPLMALFSHTKKVANGDYKSFPNLEQPYSELHTFAKGLKTMTEAVSEREKTILKSQKQFRDLFESSRDGLIFADLKGNIEKANQAFINMTGYNHEELKKLSLDQITPKSWKQTEIEIFVTQIVPRGYSDEYEKELERKDGTIIPVSVCMWLETKKGKPQRLLGHIRNITDRIKSEEETTKLKAQLNQAQKIEAIGVLAGGIAHDFNNILSAIIGYSELTLIELPNDGKIKQNVQNILKAGERAKNLVAQILAFSRQKDLQYTPLKLHLIVNEALALLQATLPTTIEITSDIDRTCGKVMADPSQMHQIIMNLCTNAYHAMIHSGGKLEVSLKNITLDKENLKAFGLDLKPGTYIKLDVSDTGHGMDQITLLKIFDPYFTTKKRGEGTGLGLSIIHGIVNNMNGDIVVQSEKDKGTLFHIFLPEHQEDKTSEKSQTKTQSLNGNEKILLVDDDEAIVHVGTQLLKKLGYDVIAFNDGQEALKEFVLNHQDYDLIITDMAMPDITGAELAKKALAIKPKIPIILCSGFSDQIDENSAQNIGVTEYIMKPIVYKKMALAIRRALDNKNK